MRVHLPMSLSRDYNKNIQINSLKKMSTLHHESILEDCLIEAEENFRVHNKLTQKQLDELIVRSEGVRLAIEKQAQKLFDDRCI